MTALALLPGLYLGAGLGVAGGAHLRQLTGAYVIALVLLYWVPGFMLADVERVARAAGMEEGA